MIMAFFAGSHVANWPESLRTMVWIYRTLLALIVCIFSREKCDDLLGWLDNNCL